MNFDLLTPVSFLFAREEAPLFFALPVLLKKQLPHPSFIVTTTRAVKAEI